jgi:hypothetical protein
MRGANPSVSKLNRRFKRKAPLWGYGDEGAANIVAKNAVTGGAMRLDNKE